MTEEFTAPKMPYILFNNHYIIQVFNTGIMKYLNGEGSSYGSDGTHFQIGTNALEKGIFMEDAKAIDAECNLYHVVDVIKGNRWRPALLLFGLFGPKRYYCRLVFRKCEKICFDDAKAMIIDLIIKRRWSGQTGARPSEMREMLEEQPDIVNLGAKIGFLGQYPF